MQLESILIAYITNDYIMMTTIANNSDTSDPTLPTGTTTISISDQNTAKNFDHFGLSKNLLRGIYRYGWEKPSPIQELAIPAFIKTYPQSDDKKNRKDLIAQAQSGTGKTGVFLIGTLHNLDLEKTGTQAIIASPTRELALQTFNVCTQLSTCMRSTGPPIPQLFVGGNDRKGDQNKFKKDVKIAIGTPGRIIDMIKNSFLIPDTITMLILDEADDLLSQGFAEQIHEIFSFLPKSVQVTLFSATMPSEVLLLTNRFMKEPIRFLKEREKLSLRGITQYQVLVPSEDTPPDDIKIEILIDLYGSMEVAQAVIFCNMRKKVELLSQKLKEKEFSCITMHSDMQKQDRERIMELFRKGESRILIATDVMARGIDVHHVSMVINFDIPSNKENFLHRSGRAGRFGKKGLTINLVSEREVSLIKDIEEHYNITIDALPSDYMKAIS